MASCGIISTNNSTNNATNDGNNPSNDIQSGNNEATVQKTKVGKEAFLPSINSNFEVIFFDTDNVISPDGLSYSNSIFDLGCINNCSDCYMIKSGNCEILVDCGNQVSYGTNENRQKNFCVNIIRKIATYCTDGILDYLIVTHADSDHIQYLSMDGTLFDMIIDYQSWFTNYYSKFNNSSEFTNIYNEQVNPITTISNIIDFDSIRVRSNSSEDNGNNLLISSQVYKNYVYKRDKVLSLKSESKYASASYLFSEVTKSTKEKDAHNFNSMPEKYYKKVYVETNGLAYENNLRTIIDKKYINSITNTKYNLIELNGLNEIETENGKRYTYNIDLNGNVKLKILYNWFYDSYWNHSFDSQDRNNISVSFIVEDDKSKLLILGDLGGDGENGLLRYYQGTDVLKNISCFKASHHGSTNNNENSYELFKEISSSNKINVILTGVIQGSRDFYTNLNIISENQLFYNSLKGVAVLENKFFTSTKDLNYNLYCTQTVTTKDFKNFYNQPLYGDIHVVFNGDSNEVYYTYHGDVKTFINNSNKNIEESLYVFKTNSMNLLEIDLLNKLKLIG